MVYFFSFGFYPECRQCHWQPIYDASRTLLGLRMMRNSIKFGTIKAYTWELSVIASVYYQRKMINIMITKAKDNR